jgi:hypothetical protein
MHGFQVRKRIKIPLGTLFLQLGFVDESHNGWLTLKDCHLEVDVGNLLHCLTSREHHLLHMQVAMSLRLILL